MGEGTKLSQHYFLPGTSLVVVLVVHFLPLALPSCIVVRGCVLVSWFDGAVQTEPGPVRQHPRTDA